MLYLRISFVVRLKPENYQDFLVDYTMSKWVWVFTVLIILSIITSLISVGVEGKRPKKNKNLRNDEVNKDCSKWIYGDCIPKNSTLGCGKGTRAATRNGTDCKTTKKTTNCTLRCNGHGKCTYGKVVFSECDMATQTVIGTKSLVKGDANCKQTITVTKRCKKNKKNDKKNKKGKQHHVTKPDRHVKKLKNKQGTKGE